MKISRTHMIIALLVVSCGWALAMVEFIAPKKKTPSVSQLKEKCGHALAEHLENFARIMRLLGTVQTQVLEHTYALLEDDKQNPLHKKNNSALQECQTRMASFNESLQNIEQQLEEYSLFLENFENKKIAVITPAA